MFWFSILLVLLLLAVLSVSRFYWFAMGTLLCGDDGISAAAKISIAMPDPRR